MSDDLFSALNPIISDLVNPSVSQALALGKKGQSIPIRLPSGVIILARAGNEINSSQVVLGKDQNGGYLCYAGSSPRPIKRTTNPFKTRAKTGLKSSSLLKVLILKENTNNSNHTDIYIGGDRPVTELITTLTVPFEQIRQASITATGNGLDDWIISLNYFEYDFLFGVQRFKILYLTIDQEVLYDDFEPTIPVSDYKGWDLFLNPNTFDFHGNKQLNQSARNIFTNWNFIFSDRTVANFYNINIPNDPPILEINNFSFYEFYQSTPDFNASIAIKGVTPFGIIYPQLTINALSEVNYNAVKIKVDSITNNVVFTDALNPTITPDDIAGVAEYTAFSSFGVLESPLENPMYDGRSELRFDKTIWHDNTNFFSHDLFFGSLSISAFGGDDNDPYRTSYSSAFIRNYYRQSFASFYKTTLNTSIACPISAFEDRVETIVDNKGYYSPDPYNTNRSHRSFSSALLQSNISLTANYSIIENIERKQLSNASGIESPLFDFFYDFSIQGTYKNVILAGNKCYLIESITVDHSGQFNAPNTTGTTAYTPSWIMLRQKPDESSEIVPLTDLAGLPTSITDSQGTTYNRIIFNPFFCSYYANNEFSVIKPSDYEPTAKTISIALYKEAEGVLTKESKSLAILPISFAISSYHVKSVSYHP